MNTRASGQFLFAIYRAVVEYPSQLLRGVSEKAGLTPKFQPRVVMGAMPNGIFMIGLRCIPAKVRQPAIVAYSVIVAALHSLWAWPDKGFKHNRVQRAHALYTIGAEANQDVPIRCRLAFVKDSSFPRVAGLRGTRAFYSPKAAYFVILKAWNGSPFFMRKFISRKAGRLSASLRTIVRLILDSSSVAASAFTVQPVAPRTMTTKRRHGLGYLTSATCLLLYSCLSHASSPVSRMSVVRPVRMLTHSFGSLCILPQFA